MKWRTISWHAVHRNGRTGGVNVYGKGFRWWAIVEPHALIVNGDAKTFEEAKECVRKALSKRATLRTISELGPKLKRIVWRRGSAKVNGWHVSVIETAVKKAPWLWTLSKNVGIGMWSANGAALTEAIAREEGVRFAKLLK